MKKIKLAASKLVFAGTFGLADHHAQKRICIGINIMCLWVIVINFTVGMAAFFATHEILLFYGISIEIIAAIFPIVLNFQRKYEPASICFFGVISLSTCYFSCLLGKTVESQLMIIYLIGVSIFLFDTIWMQVISVTLSISMIIFIEWNFKDQMIKPMTIEPNVQGFMRWAVYGVVIFLVLVTFILYKRNNNVLLKRLQVHNTKVEYDLHEVEKKNKFKDRFITNATHEMKVSFYSIFAIINILYKAERKPSNNDLKKSIDDLRAACGISKSIIDNILEYAKNEAGLNIIVRNQLIDIRLVVSNIIEVYKYLADERKVKIKLLVAEDVDRHILIDEVILRHIITNLLHNAIKFTRSGSEIEIRISSNKNELSVCVKDHGEGISANHLDEIFEAFFTRNPEGLGLGLYIVKLLVFSLRGKVKVMETSNEGTVFYVGIPNRPKPQPAPQYQSFEHFN